MASTNEKASVLDETKPNNSKKAKLDEHDYAKRPQRVTREELFIILAFWMGESPLTFPQTEDKTLKTKKNLLNGVGAVLINPDNKIFALDCSRKNGLCVTHGVIRLLMKFPNHAQRSAIYSSRKPCSRCTKMLVQCKVAKVFYLPIPPEVNDEDDIKKVDHLFKVSEVAQSVFVPDINRLAIQKLDKNDKRLYSPKNKKIEEDRLMKIESWKASYWDCNDEWVTKDQLKEGLPWLAWDDKMKEQVNADMMSMFEWLSYVAIRDPADYVKFKKINGEPNEDQSKDDWQRLARHSTRLAQIVSYKTDDPKTGVGAVIVMDKDIVAIGWNGFPSKALYGDFPRASDSDSAVDQRKYSYVIHAEQNALLTRNKDFIKSHSTTLFVTKTPCDECVPLLVEAGIKVVVLPGLSPKRETDKSELKYTLFGKTDDFDKFHSYPPIDDVNRIE